MSNNLNEKLDDLSNQQTTVNLRTLFPIAIRYIIRRSLPFLLAYISVMTLLIRSDGMIDNVDSPEYGLQFFYQFLDTLFVIVTSILIVKLLYEMVYYCLYSYGIESGHLVVTSGVFMRKRGAFPVNSITDIFLSRNFIDLLFGLYRVDISTASSDIGEPHGAIYVPGLGTNDAVRLQDYLQTLLRKTRPEIQKVKQVAEELAEQETYSL